MALYSWTWKTGEVFPGIYESIFLWEVKTEIVGCWIQCPFLVGIQVCSLTIRRGGPTGRSGQVNLGRT